MEKLKIFLSYKNKNKLLKSDILTPIQTGRAIADEVFEDMIGDDTGENISAKNERYCELTAQYWAWKNYEQIGNPDYVGFMHYRRHFIFDDNLKHTPYVWIPNSEFYFVKSIYKNYEKHFSEELIKPFVENSDCVAFKRVNVRLVARQNNMKDHFYLGMPSQKKEVFEIYEKVLKETYPDYVETFEKFKNGITMFCCNSFIMPRDMFFEYSEFLFSILGKVDELVDHSNFNNEEIRFLGYLGEYTLSIFLFHKLENPEFMLCELPGTFVNNEFKKFFQKLAKCNILRKITFGKAKKHYTKKYIFLSRRVRPKKNKNL